jgi:MscS family membrane protein
MLREGPFDLSVWQWLAVAAAVVVGYTAGRLVGAILLRIAAAMTRRTDSQLDDELLARLTQPLRYLLTVAGVRLLLPLVQLHPEAQSVATSILLAAFGLGLVWGALRAIDVVIARMTAAHWAVARPTSRAVLSLLGRVAKVIVVVIAGISFLGAVGLPVASLLAGLGIGGIALAFGAQKTVENLFGAVAIGVDQPLREGDFVRIDNDVLGTVESVGLRSTRVRTLDRTVVTLPNGKLADMKVVTYAVRDRCRLSTTLGVVYGTTGDQVKTILAGFERVLRAHPNIWPDDVIVRFVGFGSSSLDIEIMAWFLTSDFGQFRIWRQEVLLGFMTVVEEAKSSCAFPTRTVHLVQPPAVR